MNQSLIELKKKKNVYHPRKNEILEIEHEDPNQFKYTIGLNQQIDQILNTHLSFDREDDSQEFYHKLTDFRN